MSNSNTRRSNNETERRRQQQKKIRFGDLYYEFNGHKVKHLQIILEEILQHQENDNNDSSSIIWTAGDSSLDNKYWFNNRQSAVQPIYSNILDPPTSVCDVTYWLNYLSNERYNSNDNNSTEQQQRQRQPQQQEKNESQQQQPSSSSLTNNNNNTTNTNNKRFITINTAVEATTLNERTFHLRSQDVFLRDNIRDDDVLIVSIGGNDVALAPCPCTIISMIGLICCLPTICLENAFECCSFAGSSSSIPIDDYCCGCGPSLCSCCCTCPPCTGYFNHLFGTRVQKYIEKLTSKTKPKLILVCMIYYPDETNTPSWAGGALGALRYNTNPNKLQVLINKAYEHATSKIKIDGSKVIPVPLFRVLDGKHTEDYIARVEPSSIGGYKMAEFLLDIIHRHYYNNVDNNTTSTTTTTNYYSTAAVTAPSSAFIEDR